MKNKRNEIFNSWFFSFLDRIISPIIRYGIMILGVLFAIHINQPVWIFIGFVWGTILGSEFDDFAEKYERHYK